MEVDAKAWVGFLELWAVFGPILVGFFTDRRARRRYLNDREWDQQREEERAARRAEEARQEREEEHALRHRAAKYEELKSAIVDFAATSQQYMMLCGTNWRESFPEGSFKVYDEFVSLQYRQNSHLALLVPEELGSMLMRAGRTMVNLPGQMHEKKEAERPAVLNAAMAEYGTLTVSLREYLQGLQ